MLDSCDCSLAFLIFLIIWVQREQISNHLFKEKKKKMYPRVKVREEEKDEDQYDFEMRSLQSLKGFQFISLDDLSSPASVVRIPRLSSSNSDIPSISALKGESRDKRLNNPENNRTNIRASPVPRPRAVLSSPDNDGLIAHKTKRGEELLLSGSKNQCQNRHSQCTKSLPVAVRVRRELKEVTDSALDRHSKPQRVFVTPDPNKRADKSKSDKRSNNKTATVLIK